MRICLSWAMLLLAVCPLSAQEDWYRQKSPARGAIRSIHFIDLSQGWALADSIWKTRDGGRSWYAVGNLGADSLTCLQFVDSLTGFIAGHSGRFFITHDGGQTWRKRKQVASANLTGITFQTRHQGWVVGTHGVIMRTMDSGQSWAAANSGTQNDLHALYFIDPKSGWAVGDRGTVLHTRDGGQTWRRQELDYYKPLYGVHFKGRSMGWLVGSEGVIFKTEDDGQSWQRQKSGTAETLRAILFPTAHQGWAVGDRGTLLHSKNSGDSWQTLNSRIDANLLALSARNSTTAWAASARSEIIKTTAGIMAIDSLPAAAEIRVNGKPVNWQANRQTHLPSGRYNFIVKTTHGQKIEQQVWIPAARFSLLQPRFHVFAAERIAASALVPGLGQSMAGARWKSRFYFYSMLGFASTTAVLFFSTNQREDAYLRSRQEYLAYGSDWLVNPDSVPEVERRAIQAALDRMQNNYSRFDKRRGKRNLALGLTIGLYAANLLDAMLYHSRKNIIKRESSRRRFALVPTWQRGAPASIALRYQMDQRSE